jgi:ATP-dependent DNA ligase
MTALPRNLRPLRLSRRSEPFDSDQHIFELKIDGFRALAHIFDGQGQLISSGPNPDGKLRLSLWADET